MEHPPSPFQSLLSQHEFGGAGLLSTPKLQDVYHYAELGPDAGDLVLFIIVGMQKLKIRLSYGRYAIQGMNKGFTSMDMAPPTRPKCVLRFAKSHRIPA